MKKTPLLILIITMFLSGCVSSQNTYKTIPAANTLYEKALVNMDKSRYQGAIENLKDLIVLYPFTNYSDKAHLMIGYAYFKTHDYDSALTNFDHYLNKTHKGTYKEYASYMKLVSGYELMINGNKNMGLITQTIEQATNFIEQFPNSKYTNSAEKYLTAGKELQAIRDLDITIFYYKTKNNYSAAIARLEDFLEVHSNSSHVPKAVYYLILAYKQLKMNDEALATYKKYTKAHPRNSWIERGKSAIDDKNM